jgi:hypothetical protein
VLDVNASASAAADDAMAAGGGTAAVAGTLFADGRRQTLIDVLAARGDGKASSDDEL